MCSSMSRRRRTSTKRQRELLEEFHKPTTKETSPTSDGFFAKLKNLFES